MKNLEQPPYGYVGTNQLLYLLASKVDGWAIPETEPKVICRTKFTQYRLLQKHMLFTYFNTTAG